MEAELPLYAEKYGNRGMLRTYHGTEKDWKNPNNWAWHCAQNVERCYGFGCRDLQPVNEIWGLEGLGDGPDDYRWVGYEWAPRFLDALELELGVRGIPIWPDPNGIRIWLFAPSPGHNYEDNHIGLRHLVNVFKDPRVFGSCEHYYWERAFGFFGTPEWYYLGPGRMLKVRERMLGYGIDKPVWIGEYNRPVDRLSDNDIRAYAEEIKRFTRWINSLDWVVGATYFLGCCFDSSNDFFDLTWNRTPGIIEMLSDGWDRRDEGEWGTGVVEPIVGEGFRKAEALVGPWKENEIWHFPGEEHETSMAVGARGFATWRRRTNETIVYCDNGDVWTDLGNRGNGQLVKVHPR